MFTQDFEKMVRRNAERLYLKQLLKTSSPKSDVITNRPKLTFHKSAILAFILGACWCKEQVEQHKADLHSLAGIAEQYAQQTYTKRLRSKNYNEAFQKAFTQGVGYAVEYALLSAK